MRRTEPQPPQEPRQPQEIADPVLDPITFQHYAAKLRDFADRTELQRTHLLDGYKGRKVSWRGFVCNTAPSALGGFLLSISPSKEGYFYILATCSFDVNSKDQLLALRPDQEVTVRGVIREPTLIGLERCELSLQSTSPSIPSIQAAGKEASTAAQTHCSILQPYWKLLAKQGEYKHLTALQKNPLLDAYKGRKVRWCGFVSNINEHGDGILVLGLDAKAKGFSGAAVMCLFDKNTDQD